MEKRGYSLSRQLEKVMSMGLEAGMIRLLIKIVSPLIPGKTGLVSGSWKSRSRKWQVDDRPFYPTFVNLNYRCVRRSLGGDCEREQDQRSSPARRYYNREQPRSGTVPATTIWEMRGKVINSISKCGPHLSRCLPASCPVEQ